MVSCTNNALPVEVLLIGETLTTHLQGGLDAVLGNISSALCDLHVVACTQVSVLGIEPALLVFVGMESSIVLADNLRRAEFVVQSETAGLCSDLGLQEIVRR